MSRPWVEATGLCLLVCSHQIKKGAEQTSSVVLKSCCETLKTFETWKSRCLLIRCVCCQEAGRSHMSSHGEAKTIARIIASTFCLRYQGLVLVFFYHETFKTCESRGCAGKSCSQHQSACCCGMWKVLLIATNNTKTDSNSIQLWMIF